MSFDLGCSIQKRHKLLHILLINGDIWFGKSSVFAVDTGKAPQGRNRVDFGVEEQGEEQTDRGFEDKMMKVF